MRGIKLFASVFIIALIVLSALNLLAQVQRPYDQYFALYTLGANGKTENYFPRDRSDILPGIRIQWFANVYNHIGTVQLVRVDFKLLNMTMEGPNQIRMEPSQRDPFFEYTRLLLSNETWILSVYWSVDNATHTGFETSILSLSFNNETVSKNVSVSSDTGFNYRIVIELWVYDESTGTFNFQWDSNGQKRIAWNQIWFNMTRTSILPQG